MNAKLHSLLARQIKKRFAGPDGVPHELEEFIAVVDAAYRQFDEDRSMLERSLDLSSQELLARNSEMRAILAAFPDIIFHLDESGSILDCCASNPWDLYRPISAMRGRRVQSLFPEDLGRRFDEAVRRAQESRGAVSLEYALTVPSGEKNWEARIVRARGGRILMIVRDITSRVKTQEALLRIEGQFHQIQKMEGIGRLAGGIAHDFNNLLTAILGLADMMLEEVKDTSPLAADLKEIAATGRRAAELTQQLLAFSRRQVVEPKVICLNDRIPALTKMLRRLIGENIELIASLAPGLDNIRVDPGQVEQVIVNLCVNARDAMPDGGNLRIETSNFTIGRDFVRENPGAVAGEYVRLSVVDEGTGLSEEAKAHLFEPFFTTKPRGKGTGLGLATCYGITKQNGGYIGARAAAGGGTVFSVYLPRFAGAAAAPDKPAQARPSLRGRETLLIVEDEAAVRNLMVRVLRMQGYRILAARDGGEGLRLVEEDKERRIRLVITDIVMPRSSGMQLAHDLKSARPDVRILFTTGYTDETPPAGDGRAASETLLHKPFAPHDLALSVRRLLDS